MKAIPATIIVLVILLALGFAQQKQQPRRGDVERGRYLVEQVAMCGQCHTPRDEGGHLLPSQRLLGAPVMVGNPYPGTAWALSAPRIATLPAYSDEEAIRLLTEGIARDGRRLRPPMPQFRFNREDAAAVTAYLRSVRQ